MVEIHGVAQRESMTINLENNSFLRGWISIKPTVTYFLSFMIDVNTQIIKLMYIWLIPSMEEILLSINGLANLLLLPTQVYSLVIIPISSPITILSGLYGPDSKAVS